MTITNTSYGYHCTSAGTVIAEGNNVNLKGLVFIPSTTTSSIDVTDGAGKKIWAGATDIGGGSDSISFGLGTFINGLSFTADNADDILVVFL